MVSLIILPFSSGIELYARELDIGGIDAGEDGCKVSCIQHMDSPASDDKDVHFTLRLGMGGFRDDRSPEGELGGGQIALDIRPVRVPFALSISSEYYTNSANPTHSYEISDLTVINILYMGNILKSGRAHYFVGGGLGWLKVPGGEEKPDAEITGGMYDIEGGINYRLFWKIGMYGTAKYLYARKNNDGMRVIDFSKGIVLLGLTFNFGL